MSIPLSIQIVYYSKIEGSNNYALLWIAMLCIVYHSKIEGSNNVKASIGLQ